MPTPQLLESWGRIEFKASLAYIVRHYSHNKTRTNTWGIHVLYKYKYFGKHKMIKTIDVNNLSCQLWPWHCGHYLEFWTLTPAQALKCTKLQYTCNIWHQKRTPLSRKLQGFVSGSMWVPVPILWRSSRSPKPPSHSPLLVLRTVY